jgi:hypothetical protein
MQPRQLRLGDIVDDYCPRERRVTNHAIVAMVDQQVRQTRCTTCDAEHEYKEARVPPQRRKKDSPAALQKQLLSEAPPGLLSAAKTPPAEPAGAPPPPVAAPSEPPPDPPNPVEQQPGDSRDDHDEEGPVHRPLIRATLPRPEGQAPERPIPEFTFRQAGARGRGRFRPGDARGGGGHRPGGRPTGGGGHGQGRSSSSRPFAGPPRGNRQPAPIGRSSSHSPQQGHGHGGGGRGKKRSK